MTSTTERDLRILVLAPTGRDTDLLADVLSRENIVSLPVADLSGLCRELRGEAGAAIVAQEALSPDGYQEFEKTLRDQPTWSDIPVIILLAERSAILPHQDPLRSLQHVASITLLERPVRTMTLVTTAKSALRARRRQFEVLEQIRQREAAEAALREEVARKNRFLSMLAHELRNPLAPIQTALNLFEMSPELEPNVMREAHEIIATQVKHLSRLVDDLMEVARLSRGRVSIRHERIDLARLLHQAVRNHRQRFQSMEQHLEIEIPDRPLWLLGDDTRLMQIFDNLLSNARKFTGPGGWISVRLLADNDRSALVRIRDSGVGIPQHLLPYIFEPFSQADTSLDRPHGGLGLGLSIVKSLVELHGGTIEARSEGPDKGAEFELTLPLAPELTPVQDLLAALKPAALKGRQILLVEDHPGAGRTMQLLLQSCGAQVRIATDGLEGVRVAEEARPDLIICDIGLPKLDGYGVARRLRGSETTRHLPLIALSGYDSQGDVRKSMEAGFDAHLVKPADSVALLATIENYLNAPGR
jgi:signal transduction histidine kinase